jgi:hypothetical protein
MYFQLWCCRGGKANRAVRSTGWTSGLSSMPSYRSILSIAATYSDPSAKATPAGWVNFSATIRTVLLSPKSLTS